MKLKPWLKRSPLYRPAAKLRTVWSYRHSFSRNPSAALHYLLYDPEISNFTYEIENESELITFLAEALRKPASNVEAIAQEFRDDVDFRRRLAQKLQSRGDKKDLPLFGRRLGWYCILRLTKPSVVVETGTHDGLGAAALLRALERNADEGAPGQLLTFDIDPQAGWLLDRHPFLEVHLGDTRETLPAVLSEREVDLFIHDSLHSYEHELFEFRTALTHASDRLIMVSDNAHYMPTLRDLCRTLDVPFFFFKERPLGHWFSGAGIGLAVYPAIATDSERTPVLGRHTDQMLSN